VSLDEAFYGSLGSESSNPQSLPTQIESNQNSNDLLLLELLKYLSPEQQAMLLQQSQNPANN
jgi:hypothetical protein